MAKQSNDQRRWPREVLDPPWISITYMGTIDPGSEPASEETLTSFYVDVLNRSRGGMLLRSPTIFEIDRPFYLQVHNPLEKSWNFFESKTRWVTEDSKTSGHFLAGVEAEPQDPEAVRLDYDKRPWRQKPHPSDYTFFRRVRMLRFISRHAVCPILNCVTHKRVKAGERFIAQGDTGDAFYVIQQGSCVARVEKSGETHTVGRLGKGDIVGEMAILTGEPRSSHVDAETDMELWVLTCSQFEKIAGQHPDLRTFLTELVAGRFASRKVTADRKIGKYLITDIVGRGGYSIVYKGIHTDLSMPVAIKMMRHNLAMDPHFQNKFKGEAKLIAQLNHPNILRVYDIEEAYRTLFIIMEYLEGMSLKDLLEKSQRITYQDTLNILTQVCAGLGHAHDQGIVHLDIKPGNIFVLPTNQVKILDFGLARPRGSELFGFVGTPFYRAPEQMDCGPIDERADIYSLGITAYEMVTGKKPYPDEGLGAFMGLPLDHDIPDPADLEPQLPKGLRDFIITCCRHDPNKRFRNLAEGLDHLQPLLRTFGPPPFSSHS
jgi:tRNA A-37 threonylcarbamoyl transferase component Bud32